MNRPTTQARVRGCHADHAVRGAVQAAVTAAHHTRPGAGSHAGQHAVFWARTAGALDLIADHEADPGRADAARADAVTARRLAGGMAAAHTAQVCTGEPVPAAASGVALEEASPRNGAPCMGVTTHLEQLPQVPDVSDLDSSEAGL